jgi:actin beta/gamma 1
MVDTVVIDNGTGYCKAGFSGEEGPRALLRTVVGRPKLNNSNDFYVGCDAIEKKGILNLNYPMEHGIITDWDDMEKVWEHIFNNELKIDPSEHNVLLTEAAMISKFQREKMVQIMFDKFKIPGLYISNPATLSLYSSGKLTGIVCESGEGVTQCVPVLDGYALCHEINRMYFGGRDITDYLVKLLNKAGYPLMTNSEREIAREIKEKLCYVFNSEMKTHKEINYKMPDGSQIKIKEQSLEAPEILFHPEMCGREEGGIAQKCYESIQKSDIDIRKELYECIVISGGNTMFNGLPERLKWGVRALAPESMKKQVEVIALERKYAAWLGGALISSFKGFSFNWVTKDEYEESGSRIVHKKCLEWLI